MRKFLAGIEIAGGLLMVLLSVFAIGVATGAKNEVIVLTPVSWKLILSLAVFVLFVVINLLAGINIRIGFGASFHFNTFYQPAAETFIGINFAALTLLTLVIIDYQKQIALFHKRA